MTASTKSFLTLVFWLIVGVGLTGLTSLVLGDWVLRGASGHASETVSGPQPERAHE